MIDLVGGMIGGLGLFMVGMWLLTENLKALASRRLRRTASRWTANRFSALLWGTLAGGITQSMPALTFIVVSTLRSGLITTKGALALILGGSIGVSALVLIVTFDIKVASFYVLGVAGAVVVSERMSRFRPLAASFLGGAMIILGLVLLKGAAAPLADQPWFGELVEGTGESLILAFLVAAFLTAIVQSSSAVSVFGISMAAIGVISVDQTIMIIYGSYIGSSVILYLLSANLAGRSRQVAMYLVSYNVLRCAIVVPLFYLELYFDLPLMKALVLALDLDVDRQLAFVYVFLNVLPLPLMLAGLGISVSILDRLWPSSQIDELSQPRFIHDHASVDVETSLMLVDLEQKRVLKALSQYFDMVRQDGNVGPLRDSSRNVLSECNEFMNDLHVTHPLQAVEDRNAMMNRQKLLSWLEDALGVLCETLGEIADRPALDQIRMSMCEGVDSVLLSLIDAIESDDRMSWEMASQLIGDRGAMMRKIRLQYLEMDPPLQELEQINVLLITNAVEEVSSCCQNSRWISTNFPTRRRMFPIVDSCMGAHVRARRTGGRDSYRHPA